MKNPEQFLFGICLFMLVSLPAFAQVNNLTFDQPNLFEKYYGTYQGQPTDGATDALVYIDYEIQNGQVLAALTNLGYSYVVATSWSDFNSKLSYPGYALAVMFNQNTGMGADLTKVTNFISAGGSMVYADWTHTASFATLFQATFTSNDNQTIMNLTSTISTGLPNPMTLANTGWGIFSTGLTATGGAEVLATFANGEAAIVRGNSGKTIVLGYLSDVPPADYRQQLFENLFVSVAPSGPADPTSVTATANPICNGSNTQLTANGAVGTVYWYTGSCGGTQISTGNPVTVSPTSTTTYYARNYDNGQFSTGCASLQVTVYPNLTAGISGGSSPICYNTSPGTFTATGSGGTGSYTYLWYKDGSSTGVTTQTYNPGPLTSSSSFYCAVTSGSCGTANTSTTSVTVYGNLGANISGGTTPICYNTSPGTFTAAGSGGTGSYTYLWYKDGSSTGITTQTYNPGALTTSASFYCAVTSGDCGTVNTTTTSITVFPEFVVGSISSDQTICYNDTPGLLTGVAPTGGNGPYTYQWQLSTDNISFDDITDANALDFQPGSLTQTTYYRQRQISANGCGTLTTNTLTILVYPTTIGGEVTGGAVVCYGAHSTLLTLSGHTGSVVKWQYSTIGTDWTDIANSLTTYTATNLTVNTWFRAVVKSGVCQEENSTATQITMFTDYHVSGYAKYYNNPKTPLDGLMITLKKGGVQQGTPVTTGANGWFDFGGLTNGTYDIEISSAAPGGQWQTWNGCNNTDYLLVSRHATGVALLASEPPVVRVSGDVIAPHPAINTLDANAVRNAARYGWLNPANATPWFDIPKWVFSGTSSGAPMVSFELNCSNVTRNIYGLCAGDVNGSYIPPSGFKQAEASVDLIAKGTLPEATELTFPLRAGQDMEVGAVTLMLNFDPQKIEITGVEMADNTAEQPYFIVSGNRLHIGWMSLIPIRVAEGQTMLLIRTKLISRDSPLRFTLDPNPVSELANGEGEVIYGAKLSMADAGMNQPSVEEPMVSIYPNPARNILFVETQTSAPGEIRYELTDLNGKSILTNQSSNATTALHKDKLDVSGLANGVYLLKITTQDFSATRKVIIHK